MLFTAALASSLPACLYSYVCVKGPCNAFQQDAVTKAPCIRPAAKGLQTSCSPGDSVQATCCMSKMRPRAQMPCSYIASQDLLAPTGDGSSTPNSHQHRFGMQTAEMPGLYQPGEYDVAGFAVGSVKQDKVIDGKQIQEGDVLVALPSSGLHSNGFSLVRKVVEVGFPAQSSV